MIRWMARGVVLVGMLCSHIDAGAGHGQRWNLTMVPTTAEQPVRWSPDGAAMVAVSNRPTDEVRILPTDPKVHVPMDLDVCELLQTGGGQGAITVQGLLSSHQVAALADPPACAKGKRGADLLVLSTMAAPLFVDSNVSVAVPGCSGSALFYEVRRSDRESPCLMRYDLASRRRTVVSNHVPYTWYPVDDDRALVGFSRSGIVEVLDATTGAERSRWSASLKTLGEILELRTTEAGDVVYALVSRLSDVGVEQIICVALESTTGTTIFETTLMTSHVPERFTFDVCADGQLLALAERGLGRLRIHRVRDGSVVGEVRTLGEIVVHGWSPAQDYVSVTTGREVRIYHVAHNGEMWQVPTTISHYVQGRVAVDADGAIVFEQDRWTADATGFQRGDPAIRLNVERSVIAATTSCNAGLLVTQASAVTAFHDVEVLSSSAAVLLRYPRVIARGCMALALARDAEGDLMVIHRPSDGWVGVIDPEGRDTLFSQITPFRSAGQLWHTALSGRSGYLLLGDGQQLEVLHLPTSQQMTIPPDVELGVQRSSAPTPIGEFGVVYVDASGTVVLYDPLSGIRTEVPLPGSGRASGVSYSRDGRELIVRSLDGGRLWRVRPSTGEILDIVVIGSCHQPPSVFDLDWHRATNTYAVRLSTDRILVIKQDPTSVRRLAGYTSHRANSVYCLSSGVPLTISTQHTGTLDAYALSGERVASCTTQAGHDVLFTRMDIEPGLLVFVHTALDGSISRYPAVLVVE